MEAEKSRVNNTLDQPFSFQTPNGRAIGGTDAGFGYGEVNEDAVIVDRKTNAVGVVDAMGFYRQGATAADCAVQALETGFTQGRALFPAEEPYSKIQKDMYDRMREAGLTEDGVCYLAMRIEGKKLHVAWAGDVQLVIIGKNGKIRDLTTPEHHPRNHDLVQNPVTGKSPGRTNYKEIEIEAGDRVVIASDGIWDNLTPDKVAELIAGKPIEEAFQLITQESEKEMKKGLAQRAKGIRKKAGERGTKSDNRSLLIYDVETLA